jgi:hypothetical protein
MAIAVFFSSDFKVVVA